MLRRITIDSTRLSVAVTPFAVGSKRSVSAQRSRRSVERPSASQAGAQPTASRVNRALYGL